MSGIRETTEATMIEAHKAGAAYWKLNPLAKDGDLATLARSCGWHGEDCAAWLAGFYGAQRRNDEIAERRMRLAD